jgi:hypothetical protein
VLEIVVVTVTVEAPGAGAAEVAGAELAAAEEIEEEVGTIEEAGAADVGMMRTSLPPMMLLFVLAPLTALFR